VEPHPRLAGTYQEFCAERGIGLATVQRLHDALGFGPPAPSDRARADALRRLTQAEVELYEAQVEQRLREAGASEQDLLERGGAAGARVPPLFEEVLVAVYRRHRQHVWLDHSIGHVERILEANGLHRRLEQPPCVCFVDLTGYTRLTEERGDAAAAELAGRLAALIEGISRGYAALEMVAQAPGAGLPLTHIGIHCGPVVFQDGDVYGTTVNIAARLSARAAPGGEVLVSRPAADRIPHPDHLEPLGPVELKGVAHPLEVFRVGPAAGGPAGRSRPGGR
jgi:class 3 adenylate cyclase